MWPQLNVARPLLETYGILRPPRAPERKAVPERNSVRILSLFFNYLPGYEVVLLSRIADELAEYAAPGFQDIGKTRRKFAERDGWRQQSVELRIGAELDRGFEPLAMGERGAARGRHL